MPPRPATVRGFSFRKETGLTGFGQALQHVLAFEGGFSDHPDDPGGATNQGITQKAYDAWRRSKVLDVRSVKRIEPLEVEQIYFDLYWLKVGAHQLPAPLAFVMFDAAVNHGVGRALAWLAETRDWREVVAHRLLFYASLTTFATFGRGWVRRMASVTRLAVEMEADPGDARLLLVFDGAGREAARVPFDGSDLLIRVRGDRVFVRPDPA